PLFWAHLDQPPRRVLDTFEIHDLTGWSLPFYPIFIPVSDPLGHDASSSKPLMGMGIKSETTRKNSMI
ncbi:MAG TPA: hypothetical protein VGL94_18885, partial [Ktedonobacteraceae bacterium]